MNFKKLLKFATNNYFISIFVAAVLFAGFVSMFKFFFTKPTYVYAKVKVGQGLWWASTQQPNIWFVKAIKPGAVERDLVGSPIAEILTVRYYPWWVSITNQTQYVVYITLKLKVSENKNTQEYSFNRSTIGVGSPVDFEFSSTQFSGTIIELSSRPFTEQYVTKTVTLTKQYAYPWEYDQIKVGDSYYDGKNTVFEVLNKTQTGTGLYLPGESSNNHPESLVNSSQPLVRRYITVTVRVRLRKLDNQLVFGEEQMVAPGKNFATATQNFTFADYIISEIE